MVKSTDGAPGAEMSTPSSAETQAGGQITSETLGTQTAMTEAQAGVAATMEKPSEFQDIHFDFDQSFIREDARPTLRTVADYLKANPAASILIEGHCDERGTAEYNIALGERRAESTKSYLVSLGVKAGALSTVSFGEEKPLDPGHDEAAWAKNRRAHFVRK
ncbi:MAG: peptidoglycan-associated lipoprotein Pal [Deltaproteobacteria bacterium]|nr:MAG: peptidoglycan-associated lipoprotein Pal [Deltaproteobacteria bacterium]